jgi:hypothetical protein
MVKNLFDPHLPFSRKGKKLFVWSGQLQLWLFQSLEQLGQGILNLPQSKIHFKSISLKHYNCVT